MGALQQVVRPFFFISSPRRKNLSPPFLSQISNLLTSSNTHAMKSAPRLNLNHAYNLLLVKSKYMYNGRLKSI